MHPNKIFRQATDIENLAFASERGFGTLAVSAADGPPLLSHIPFFESDSASADGHRAVDLHLVRSNPIARLLKDGSLQAKLAVLGPDSYVSPDWYGLEDQVPTWNYVAVHLTGRLEQLPVDELSDLLARESAVFEGRLAPKPPWTIAKMDQDAFVRMMKAIMPCRLHIDSIDGTWKLNQNKPEEVRLAAADRINSGGLGHEIEHLGRLQRDAS